MRAAEQRLLDLGCPELNPQVRAGNERVGAFCRRLGFDPDGAVRYGRRLIPDD